MDREGPWAWDNHDAKTLLAVLGHLKSVETMTVQEAFQGGYPGKDYPVEALPTKTAQDRLVALKLDDQTQISRLRFGGAARLYGFRRDNVFYVIWWDPNHEVWPTAD